MQARIKPAAAVMASNLLLSDIMRSAPDWRTIQADTKDEIDRIEAMRDEDARDRAEAHLERCLAVAQEKQAVIDAQAAPIEAFAEMAEAALRRGEEDIEVPQDIAIQILAYSDDLAGAILQEVRHDPKPFIDAVIGDVACHELMERLGVGRMG